MAKIISVTKIGTQKINYKKALAVFLLGQMAVSGAWGVTPIVADSHIDGTMALPDIDDSANFTADNITLYVDNGGTADNSLGGTAAITSGAFPIIGHTLTINTNGTGKIHGAVVGNPTAIQINNAVAVGTVIINNNGTGGGGIFAFAPVNNAINLTGSGAKLTLNNVGDISGYIVGAAGGDQITNSGTITGNITTGLLPSTITVDGGLITGNITGGANGDNINLNGGRVVGNITGAGGAGDVLNVGGDFTTEGTIATIETINANVGTFTINNAIIGVTNKLTTALGATITLGSSIDGAVGAITNAGTLNMNVGGKIGAAAAMGNLTNTGDMTLNNSTLNGFRITQITSNSGKIDINNTLLGTASLGPVVANQGTINVTNTTAVGNVTAAAFTNNGNGTLNVNGPMTLTGAFTNSVASDKLVVAAQLEMPLLALNNTAGTVTMNAGGTIGNTAAIGVVTNTGTMDITANAVNAFRSGNVANNPGGSITINTTGAGTVTTAALNNQGNFTINNNVALGVTIGGVTNGGAAEIHINNSTGNAADVSIGPFINNAGGTLYINGPTTATGNFANNALSQTFIGANLIIGAGNTLTNNQIVEMKAPATLTGKYVAGNNSELIINVVNGVESTLTVSAGLTDFSANPNTITINNDNNSFLTNGRILTLVNSTGGLAALVGANLTIDDPSPTLQYINRVANGNKLQVTVSRYTPPGSNANEGAVSQAYSRMMMSATGDASVVGAAIDATKSTVGYDNAITQLTPNVNSANAARPSADNSSIVMNEIGGRLDQIARLGITDLKTGYAAGGMTSNKNVWIKGFGASNRQGKYEESLGYNANIGGFAFGMDHQLKHDSWVGLGLSYANTHVKTKDATSDLIKIDSYQATLYGTYSPAKYYVDGFLALAHNKYRTKRNISFSTIDRTATAKFNGLQPSVKVASGYIHSYGDFKIIPNVSLQYSYLNQKEYDETGAKSINLKNVSSKDVQLLEGGVGLKFAVFHKDHHKTISPDIHVMALYDIVNTKQEITSQFEGGGGNFTIDGVKPAKTTYNIGAGLTYVHKDRLHFTFNYDLRSKKQFIGHSGSLAVKYMI